MRALGFAALVIVAACSKKSDGGGEKAKPAEIKPADPPPVAKMIDCEALVTAADIATACGVDVTTVEIKKGAIERGTGATACVRSARLGGAPWLQFSVNAAGTSAEGVKNVVELSRKTPNAEIKDVEVGDGGLLIVKQVEATKATRHDLEATKGTLWFKLATEVPDGGKELCPDDGLVAIAKTIASHLP
jgi:hypothetical protein